MKLGWFIALSMEHFDLFYADRHNFLNKNTDKMATCSKPVLIDLFTNSETILKILSLDFCGKTKINTLGAET